MLFSIGRSATGRLASTAFATSSTNPVVFQAAVRAQFKARGVYGRFPRIVRGFATAGRPKKETPSKAVKTPTKKSTKKSTGTTKAKAKGTSAQKAKPKPKPKAKPKSKSTITPEQKAVLERRKLKKTALYTEPKLLPAQPWGMFVAEHIQGTSGNATGKLAALAQEFKALSSDELQRLKSKAELAKAKNKATYKAWVESHDPQAIYDANLARRLLKKKYDIPKATLKLIRDERLPKRPVTAFALFSKARWASGEYANSGSVTAVASKLGEEWKSLTPAERKSYEDAAKTYSEVYQKEMATVLPGKTVHAS